MSRLHLKILRFSTGVVRDKIFVPTPPEGEGGGGGDYILMFFFVQSILVNRYNCREL